jgi:hypothetical protein
MLTTNKANRNVAIALLLGLAGDLKKGQSTKLQTVEAINMALKYLGIAERIPVTVDDEPCEQLPLESVPQDPPVSMVVPDVTPVTETKSKAPKAKPPGLD